MAPVGKKPPPSFKAPPPAAKPAPPPPASTPMTMGDLLGAVGTAAAKRMGFIEPGSGQAQGATGQPAAGGTYQAKSGAEVKEQRQRKLDEARALQESKAGAHAAATLMSSGGGLMSDAVGGLRNRKAQIDEAVDGPPPKEE